VKAAFYDFYSNGDCWWPDPNLLTEDCVTDPGDLLEFAYLWLETACDQENDWCGDAMCRVIPKIGMTYLIHPPLFVKKVHLVLALNYWIRYISVKSRY
jgi:hypothetical protein